jgi:Flp pilus assembly protein TadD
VEQLNRALERRPTNPVYQLHVARALRANKEFGKARLAYEQALQLGGADFAEASAAREELAALPRS